MNLLGIARYLCTLLLVARVAAAQAEGETDSAPDAQAAPEPPDDNAALEQPADDAAVGEATPTDDTAADPYAAPPAEPEPLGTTDQPAVDPVADAAPPLERAPPAEPGYASEVGDDSADDEASYAGPFSQGSISPSIVVGSAQFGDRSYLILGGGLSYFVLDGLSVGVDGDVWVLDTPGVKTLTPQVRYVFYFVPVLQPYVGAFYRHYFIGGGFDDLDSVGGRAGVYLFAGSGGSFLGLGAIYEKFLSCDDTFRECDGWYPELSVGISF